MKAKCLSKGPALLRESASLTVGSHGSVVNVDFYPAELAETPVGRCVEKELRTLLVPAFNRLFHTLPVRLQF
jgi:hypothetical protein